MHLHAMSRPDLGLFCGAIIYFLKWGLEKIKQPQFFNIKLIFIMANFMKLTTTNTLKP